MYVCFCVLLYLTLSMRSGRLESQRDRNACCGRGWRRRQPWSRPWLSASCGPAPTQQWTTHNEPPLGVWRVWVREYTEMSNYLRTYIYIYIYWGVDNWRCVSVCVFTGEGVIPLGVLACLDLSTELVDVSERLRDSFQERIGLGKQFVLQTHSRNSCV